MKSSLGNNVEEFNTYQKEYRENTHQLLNKNPCVRCLVTKTAKQNMQP